jgi:hypothetical protein
MGSTNKESGTTLLPTDAATLEKLWQDADLSRPKPLEERPAPAPSEPTRRGVIEKRPGGR